MLRAVGGFDIKQTKLYNPNASNTILWFVFWIVVKEVVPSSFWLTNNIEKKRSQCNRFER
jgi:hypothetical protein